MPENQTYEELLTRIQYLEQSKSELEVVCHARQQLSELLDAIRKAQSLYITDADPHEIYKLLLETLVEVSQSEYGFLDEVFYDDNGHIYKKNLAISDISWDEKSKALYKQLQDREMKFTYLENLSGLPALTGETIISNNPLHDSRSKGLPQGHPPVNSFMGMPLYFGGKLICIAGVANRKDGYSEEISDFLDPLLATCASITYLLQKDAVEKENQRKIIDSELKYRTIVENFPNGAVVLFDHDLRYLVADGMGLSEVGLDKQDMIGKTIWEIFPKETCENIVPDYRAALEGKHTISGVPFAGRVYRTQTIPVFNDDGTVNLGMVMTQDITALKISEVALQKSRQRHQTILKTAMDGYWLTDIEGRLIEVNDAYCTMSGYSEAELLNLHIWELEAVEDPEFVAEHMQKVIDVGTDRFESRHRRKNGTVFDVEVSVQYRPEEGGQCVCFLRDITEQKQSRERIFNALTWYQEIFEGSRDAIFISDENAKFISVNSAACALTGYDKNELLEIRIPDLHDTVDLDAYNRYHARIMDGEPILSEAKIRLKNGERVDTEFSNKRITVSGKAYMHTAARDISDRKRAGEMIEELNQRLTIATDSAGIGVWDFDLEKNILYWDNWMYRIYGIDPNDFSGAYEAWKSGVHPRDLARADAEVQKAINQGAPFDTSFRIVRPSGEIRYLRAYARVTYNLDGEPVKMTGVNIDVTEQMQFEAVLKESETKFSTLVDQAPAALFLHDMEGNIIDVNKATLDGYGYTLKQLKRLKAKDIDPDYIEREDQGDFWEELEAKKRIDFEACHRRRDGTLFPVRVSLAPITLSGRKHIFALAMDMSEYKKAQEKLNISEERFRTIFDQAAVGVALVSTDGFFLELNDKICEIVGYTKDELHKMTYRDITHPDDIKLDENFVERVITGEIDSYEIEKRYVHKHGYFRWVKLYSNVVRGIDGTIKYAVAVVTDISKQKTAEEEREKLFNQLNQAQKMESIGNLAGGIAHDFNNILFPIVGMSELLMEDLPQNSPQWENAEEIFKAGKRGRNLVQQILAFSRQSEHKLIPARIQNVLKEVLQLSRSSIPSYIDIKHDVQSDCGMVMADPIQIHQVAMNIITNAYHAVEEAGGEISVSLKEVVLEDSPSLDMSFRPGKYAVLSITDTGHGMSSDLIKKIFDPYFTTKEKGRGTGLGLAVVHGIVKGHNGFIHLSSEIGKGTKFDVYFPLLERSVETALTKKDEENQRGHERILLVDDEEPIVKLETQMLERMGYRVTSSLHSVEALEAFRAEPSSFDLVISDMTMPAMSGDRLARELIAIRPDIPIIICTGFSERLDKEKAENIGVKGFLMKPIAKAEMAKTVRRVLDEA